MNIKLTIKNSSVNNQILINSFSKFIKEITQSKYINNLIHLIDKTLDEIYIRNVNTYKLINKKIIIGQFFSTCHENYRIYKLDIIITDDDIHILYIELIYEIKNNDFNIYCSIEKHDQVKYTEIYKTYFKDNKKILKNMIYDSINSQLYTICF